jgi:hypothetical protein
MASTRAVIAHRPLESDYEPLVAPMNLTFWPHYQPAGGREGQRYRSWYYYDTPLNFPATQLTVWHSNVIVAFGGATKRLKQLHQGTYNCPTIRGITADDLKIWWLGWVVHLTGDAHQPLHCVSNYGLPGRVGISDYVGNGLQARWGCDPPHVLRWSSDEGGGARRCRDK